MASESNTLETTLEVVILAAGQGTRMRSNLPKVLHCIAGKPMVSHVVESSRQIGASAIHVVVGHGAEQVKQSLNGDDIQWATQEQQLGTGHAVAQALPAIAKDSIVLVAYGDVPLVAPSTLAALVASVSKDAMSLLTVKHTDPSGYGRIIRQNNKILEIVEQKDALPEQLLIDEVNTGILAAHAACLNKWLPALSSNNAQGEYYLTDIIAMAVSDGVDVVGYHPGSVYEVEGVNDRKQLAALERYYQAQQADRLMSEGATLADPARIDIRGQVEVGNDVFIDVNAVLIGDVSIGNNVSIGPNCVIENSNIGAGSTIKANSVFENAIVGHNCEVGPFARLRPGTVLGNQAKIGNFVETKKAIIGEGSKANHLAYIGDAEIGSGTNIGAGTITCNYDGVNKFKTTMGDNVFVGSNSTLVAPISIGNDGFVGAGSTVTKDIPEKNLAVGRGKQRNISGWSKPTKK